MAFRKGQSGNPGGRPHRAKIFTQALITALKRTDPEDVEVIQRIADKLVALAEGGDIHAIKEIAGRVDGKVAQAVVGGDPDDSPLVIKVTIGGNDPTEQTRVIEPSMIRPPGSHASSNRQDDIAPERYSLQYISAKNG